MYSVQCVVSIRIVDVLVCGRFCSSIPFLRFPVLRLPWEIFLVLRYPFRAGMLEILPEHEFHLKCGSARKKWTTCFR
jgi:hypothetical protein